MCADEVFIVCPSLSAVARLAGGDQPNRHGRCPICQSEDCDWEILTGDEVNERGYAVSTAPAITINNHGGNGACVTAAL